MICFHRRNGIPPVAKTKARAGGAAIAAALTLAVFAGGCNVDTGLTHHQQTPAPPSPPSEATSNAVYPDNWDTIVISAHYANEKAYGNGHWWVDRTDCGDEQYGPFESSTWNAFATVMNTALKLQPLPTGSQACSDLPPDYEMDGTAVAQMTDGTSRPLFDVKNWQYCTTISDPIVAAEALRWINDIVVLTNRAGCPPSPVVTPTPGPY